MTFGTRLKQAREQRGFNQKQLAESLDITPTRLNYWEKDKREPDIGRIKQLASALQVSTDFLIGSQPLPKPAAPLSPTPPAAEHLKKYRALDGHCKTIVDLVLDEEYKRIVSALKPEEPEANLIRLDFSEQPCSAGRGTYLGQDVFSEIQVEENGLTKRASFAVPVSGDSMEPIYSNGDILLIDKNVEVLPGDVGLFILDNEGYVKKLGKKELLSLNPDYPPIPLEDSVRCCGKVIGLLQKGWIKGKGVSAADV